MNRKIILFIFIFFLVGISFIRADIIWGGEDLREFDVIGNEPVCFGGSDSSYWKYWDSGLGQMVIEDVSDENTNCYKDNGIPTRSCCPDNSGECITSPGDSDFGTCTGLLHPFLCSDYSADRYGGDINAAEEACDNFHPPVALRSVDAMVGKQNYCGSTQSNVNSVTGETCWWIIVDCKCKWDSAASSCKPAFSRTNSNCVGDPIDIIGECEFTSTSRLDKCDTLGTITVEWDASWSGDATDIPPECVDGAKQFKCEDIVKLPFFGFVNFVFSVLVIAGVYLIWRNKNESD